MKLDVLTLAFGGGHSLILNNLPFEKMGDAGLLATIFKEVGINNKVEQFGLFDMSTPNYTTYYPEVTAADLNPTDAEFIFPTFRLLSATTVNKNSSPISFPEEVLKASIGLLVGQSVYPDHEQATGNAVGVIINAFWQESYKIGTLTVPGGINGVLKIDGKSNPRIARGIMMKPPSIHSNSVTVSFTWEKSHPNMADDEFRNKVGTYDEKGNLIGRIANKIVAYHETSLVPHGADVFAQAVGEDGKIVLPKYAKIMSSLSADLKSTPYIFSDYKDSISMTADPLTKVSNINQNLNTMNPKFVEFILKAMASTIDPKTVTEENFEALLKPGIDDITAKLASVATLTKERDDALAAKTTAETSLTDMTTERDSYKTKLETAENNLKEHTTKDATEATRLYKLAFGDKAKDDIIASFEKSTPEALKAHIKEYQELADQKFPMTCKKCGSTEVNRASSSKSEGAATITNKSTEDVMDDLQNKHTYGKGSQIHA